MKSGVRPCFALLSLLVCGPGEWRFLCGGNTQTRLMVADEVGKDTNGTRVVAMVAGSTKPPQFTKLPVRIGPYEMWTAVITADAMKNLLTVPRLETGESTLLPNGKTTSTVLEIDTRGLEAASVELSAACQAARPRTPPPKWPSPLFPPRGQGAQVRAGLPSPPASAK